MASPEIVNNSRSAKIRQVFCLCVLDLVLNQTCKAKDNIEYASGDATNDSNLTDYPTFLHKLAQVCDFKKGGDAVTALIVVKGDRGPEYNVVSNTGAATQRVEEFLYSFLTYIGTNPKGLKDKPLQKQVLWQIMEFNSLRINAYLNGLLKALDECIHECIHYSDPNDSEIMNYLRLLEGKAKFSRDINTSTTARNKYLSDCETLIRTIRYSKSVEADSVIRVRASGKQRGYPWLQLRHHLGRFLSYREGAEIIVRASKDWPELFQYFTIRGITSPGQERVPIPKSAYDFHEILNGALSEDDIREFQSDLKVLHEYGLEAVFQDVVENIPRKTIVHSEIVLHDDLIRRGITKASAFWNDSKFIATSKPTCRLCHFYFENSDHEFEVQSSHMNIYLRWRLPDYDHDQDPEAKERHDDTVEDILQYLERDVRQILRKKQAQWRIHDSRTDTRGGRTTAGTYASSEFSEILSQRSASRMSLPMSGEGVKGLPTPPLEEEVWLDDMNQKKEEEEV